MLSSSLFSVWHLLCCLHFCKPLVTILFFRFASEKHCMTQSNYGSSCLRCLIFKVLLLLLSFSLSISFVIISHRVLFVNTFLKFIFRFLFDFCWNLLKNVFKFLILLSLSVTACLLYQIKLHLSTPFFKFFEVFSFRLVLIKASRKLFKLQTYNLFRCFSLPFFDSFVIISFLLWFVNTFLKLFEVLL